MDAQEFITLYRKFLSGNCTPQEIKLIEKHENEFELHDVPWKPEMGNKQQVKQVIKSSLKSIIDKPAAKKTSFKYWMAAALFAVALSVGILLNQNNKKSNAESVKGKRSYAVVPGCNKALLTLADGSTIDLDDSKKGLLSNQGGVSVGKAKNGEVIYQMKKLDSHSTVALFNTITTPRGGQYQIVLSDGTKVWLNAASSLKFPASFSGNQRNVQLTGEAYFEVAKNKAMPFNVAVNNLNIKVLGTHFNVNAYGDEDVIKTTLIEGSVLLSVDEDKALLKPGQQAVLSHQQINIKKFNVEEAVAWKNGYFIFENENIQSIMRKIARWYDVEVVYQGRIDEKDFGGTVSRFDSVTDVLKSLELTGTVHFKIDGRRITVMP